MRLSRLLVLGPSHVLWLVLQYSVVDVDVSLKCP